MFTASTAGLPARRHHLGDLLVTRHHARPPVDDQHQQVSVGNGPVAPLQHELVKRVLAGAEHAAGIDQGERHPLPLGRVSDHVASGPGDGRDDGAPRTRQAVEQRGLADIWTANQHDGGQRFGHGGSSARQVDNRCRGHVMVTESSRKPKQELERWS